MEQAVTITPPSKDKPGFLKRQKRAMQIQKRIGAGEADAIDEMVAFVAQNCTVMVPDGITPEDAIMELSEEQFKAIFSPSDVDPTNAA